MKNRKQTEIESTLASISDVLNWAYVARRMNVTPNYLYQRIHGYNVNGKPAVFTLEQRILLHECLTEIASEIGKTTAMLI